MTPTIIPLGELVNIQTGKLDANASSADGAYPFFTCAREPLRISDWKYNLDAVLIAGNGDLNVKHYVGKFDAYQRTYILDVKNADVLDTRFLFHFLDKYVERLREQSIGGIIKYIKLGMLTEAQFPLPPLEEQKRIAGILDQADALRRLRTRALEKLNTLGQAIFHEMFGEEIEKAHRHKTLTLIDVVEKSRGISYGIVQRGKQVDGGVPVVRISNFATDIFDGSVVVCTSPEIDAGYKRTKLRGGELTVSIRGTIGKVAIIPADANGWNVSREVAVIPLLHNSAAPFFWELLRHQKAQKSIIAEVRGVAQSGINLADLRMLPIPEDYLELSQRWAAVAEQSSKTIGVSRRLAENAEALFASLQHRAFRGEL